MRYFNKKHYSPLFGLCYVWILWIPAALPAKARPAQTKPSMIIPLPPIHHHTVLEGTAPSRTIEEVHTHCPGWKVNVGAKNFCLRKKLLGHWRPMLSYRPGLGKEMTD